MTELTIADLDQSHIGRRIRFPRPASESSGRRRMFGKLIQVQDAGACRLVTIDHNGKGDVETFGPLPPSFPVTIGGKWVKKEERPIEHRYFPQEIRTIRALMLGGPFDGERIEIDADEFEWGTRIYKRHPAEERVELVYEALTPIYRKADGIAVGKWGLVRSYDYSKPLDQVETTYRWESQPDAGLLTNMRDTPNPTDVH